MNTVVTFFSVLSHNIVNYFFPDKNPDGRSVRKFLVVITAGSFVFLFPLLLIWADIGRIYSLKDYRPPIPSTLLDRKGRVIATYFTDNRVILQENEINEKLIQAFTSIEDNNFFFHYGIDLQSIFRAFLKNMLAGSVKQGGSTITQQLAKVILTSKKRTLTRKAREAILAIALEQFFTKKQIITLYFNEIYLGHGNYGVEAAARFYFNKSSTELEYYEASILASLPSAPNSFSPLKNPKLSFYRSRAVLYNMFAMGHIDRQTMYIQIKKMLDFYETINTSPDVTAFGNRTDKAPYFSEWMRGILEKKLGKKGLYTGGYKIYSSLDLDHQAIAQDELWRALERQNKVSSGFQFHRQIEIAEKYTHILPLLQLAFDLPEMDNPRTLKQYEIALKFSRELMEYTDLINLGTGGVRYLDETLVYLRENSITASVDHVQGAFIEMDNQTGEVTVMVGGMPFSSQNQMNRAIQIKRQPGSTFKALLYSAAIDTKKLTQASVYPDTPVVFLDPAGGSWIPSNYAGDFRGFITVREALQYSVNLVSIAIARDVGLSSIIPRLADLLYVDRSQIPVNLSIALGTYEVSPYQMTRAISVIPNGGNAIQPVFYTKIVDENGNIFDKMQTGKINKSGVISASACAVMDDMLRNVVNSGTGTKIRSVGYTGYAAGKTGTTSNFRDAWFAGYNHRYTSTIWMGYDRSSKTLGNGQSGGNIVTPVWGNYQRRLAPTIKDEQSVAKFGSIVYTNICASTGLLPHEGCDRIYNMGFIPGTQPTEKGSGGFSSGGGSEDAGRQNSGKEVVTPDDFFGNDNF